MLARAKVQDKIIYQNSDCSMIQTLHNIATKSKQFALKAVEYSIQYLIQDLGNFFHQDLGNFFEHVYT
jgi:hypothetical protein